jgi:hypothetical protein
MREKEKGGRKDKNTLKYLFLHAAPMGLHMRYSDPAVQ